jgi:hypothetical protein
MDIDDGPKRDKTGAVVGQKVGTESLARIREEEAPNKPEHGALPDTRMVETGSGGRHYYFLTTKVISNSAGKVALDIDIRGSGGYVILPPSNHLSGGRYRWLTDPALKIADMPKWLERRCMVSHVDISQDSLQEEVIEDAKKKEATKLTGEQLVRLLDFIPSDCDRETWWKVGAALKKELGDKLGFKAWDDWSRKAPDKYDSKVMQVQWNSFTDKGVTGGSIFHFAKENGFRGFDIEAADAEEFRGNWCYAASIKRFVETTRLLEWDVEQFNAMFARFFSRGRPSEHVLKNPNFKLVDGVTYWPEKELYVQEVGQEKLNYWRSAGIVAAPGDTRPFLDHVRYLFPTPEGSKAELSEEGRILLQYLAYQVQHPGEKVHWALLLEGEQGNGKSYFGVVMRMVLGPHNVKMVHNDQLHETFTQWQRNTQLIVVEEMMARQRLELMNKLKPMITESWCMIREMYRPPYEQPNRFNFLFFSNHRDSLIIDSTDRRYCILKSNSAPHPERNAYYGPLFDWTRQNGPALLYFLRHEVSLEGFLPKAHAPMTEGKRALIMQSMMPLDAFIYEHVDTCEYPFRWDLHSTSTLVEPLSKFNLRVNPKEIANAFARLGYLNLGRMRVGNDDKVNLWAVRNVTTYKDMNGPQLRQVWLSQINNNPMASTDETADALLKQRPANPLHNEEAM